LFYESRRALRAELRGRRAALPVAVREAADRAIARRISGSAWLLAQRNIGLYASRPPEVDTSALRALALRRQCRLYLPRIVDYPHARMRFFRDNASAEELNRFGIAEPPPRAPMHVTAMSVVFLPLLGFDARGTRLGYGRGFYDRLLAFRRRRQGRPLLVGLAYACQESPIIQARAHDVPLDVVVTEAGIRHFKRSVCA
jgi:5-formyltetrahydrofolate cyclo-ligase